MSHGGAAHNPMDEQALWAAIRNRTQAISFEPYQTYMRDAIPPDEASAAGAAYQTLKGRTEAFLILQSGGDRARLSDMNRPLLIELIWSYWMEEGMLVQTMDAVGQRFQNTRGPAGHDPLTNLEIDPLRPLNNLLWGYVQDEPNRLSIRRRAHEYSHQYGLTLSGAATPGTQPKDRRSKFLEAFHNLLYQTLAGEASPPLNSLREVHAVLAQGAHNQFGDLPWTARVEMLVTQSILSRPEIYDFLGVRGIDARREPWERTVDVMKTLQGWSDVPVSHFRDLAVNSEQLLLSIRYGDWITGTEDSVRKWASYFRPEIQGYVHAYRAVTGVDLTSR